MDVVYPVRPGDVNEELRFSLRSLANLPHDGVWVVGHQPSWLTGVEFIPGNAQANAHANVYHNVLAACQHPDVPEEFVIFNDDFFVTAPVPKVPIAYRSTLREHLGLPRVRSAPKSWWHESLSTTLVCLQALGYEDPLSYELHVPLPVNKTRMRETLERFAAVTPHNPPQWRTLYGALCLTGAIQLKDTKVFNAGAIQKPFHSSTDLSWRHVRAKMMVQFPHASPYERVKARVR